MVADTPSIAFVTFGCPKNEVDSDRMAAAVDASALALTDDVATADIVVLNTCAFIQPAVEESIAGFFDLHTGWRTERPGRRIVVAGCLPSRYGSDLADAMPEADAFVPVDQEHRLLETLGALLDIAAGSTGARARLAPGPTAYLKVSEGCDRHCAYCTIPSIRGPFVSDTPDAIVDEARWLIEHGAREIVLVGQDIASYGVDLSGDSDLSSLLGRLDAIDGQFRIRLMYVQPDGVTDALLETIASSRHICHYLDIPVQHASEAVLRRMGRPGDPGTLRALLGRIRAALPDVVLRTTVMAGFPGETDDDAAVLEEFVRDARFDYAGVFVFSPEDGTRAARLPDQVPTKIAEERAQRLRDIADETGIERAAGRVGETYTVLVEGPDEDGDLYGRTCGQAPEVDGVTFIEADVAPGTFVDLLVTGSAGYDLIGEVP
ncbi:MAG TPA: 30S ribosomal protein S12 methylthiotransferase RimO [Coriobacteriia bacterium]|nr:MAG: Ribosomal protein S12 methylthiotransferase RimO [Actinobacteria bacterium 66_15]HAL29258.1 30S ribosomal protein S12 methylthiotransferase RimO [Coriobacteriia bacterium]